MASLLLPYSGVASHFRRQPAICRRRRLETLYYNAMHLNCLFRSVLVAGIALAAAEAHAQGTFTLSIQNCEAQTAIPGAGGQSYFDVSFSGGGTFTNVNKNLWAVDAFNNPLTTGVDSPFSSLTVDSASTLKLGSGQKYESGSSYRLLIDWTVAGNATPDSDGNGIYFNLFVRQPDGAAANAGATDVLNIQPPVVPEPSAAVLWVAGGLVYCLRRRV